MDTYEISKELLDNFIDGIPLETKVSLYDDYSEDLLNKNIPKHRIPSFDSFQIKDIRFVIFNKLIKTKYKMLFASLEQHELAMLLGISMKEYNALQNIAVRKLQILIFENNKNFMEESIDIVQELYYTSVESHESQDIGDDPHDF